MTIHTLFVLILYNLLSVGSGLGNQCIICPFVFFNFYIFCISLIATNKILSCDELHKYASNVSVL